MQIPKDPGLVSQRLEICMNKLTGKIIEVESSLHMSMVDIDVDGDIFSAIILETGATASYLKPQQKVSLIFKETEVCIGKDLSGLIV